MQGFCWILLNGAMNQGGECNLEYVVAHFNLFYGVLQLTLLLFEFHHHAICIAYILYVFHMLL